MDRLEPAKMCSIVSVRRVEGASQAVRFRPGESERAVVWKDDRGSPRRAFRWARGRHAMTSEKKNGDVTAVDGGFEKQPRRTAVTAHASLPSSSSSVVKQGTERKNDNDGSTSNKKVTRRAQLIAAVRSARRGSEHQNLKYLVAGAVAGIVSRTLVSPLEVLATLNMCAVGKVASGTMVDQMRSILANQGVRGFFRGNVANCMKVAPSKGIQFVTFEGCKRLLRRIRDHHHNRGRGGDSTQSPPLSPLERMLAGGVAGMAAAVACYPLETAKTLLTAHPELYSSVFGTLASVARTQGIGALYRGLTPTLIAMFPYVGLDLMVYEQLKIAYEKRSGKEAGLVHMLLMGAAAGSVAQTTCHPLDVVRKRLQLQGLGGRPVVYKHGFMPAMARIATEEGAPALYRGLAPQYMSVFPAAGVSYIVYERMKSFLGLHSVQ
mmetsp:Transcript_15766/g.34117  ORF Transcript_15766/g.34117 Transcript_15766/m.34117 type:complete len:435 (+) Transcript_15766:265-1569(+)